MASYKNEPRNGANGEMLMSPPKPDIPKLTDKEISQLQTQGGLHQFLQDHPVSNPSFNKDYFAAIQANESELHLPPITFTQGSNCEQATLNGQTITEYAGSGVSVVQNADKNFTV